MARTPRTPGPASSWRQHDRLIAGAIAVSAVLAALALQAPPDTRGPNTGSSDGDGGTPPPSLPAGPDVIAMLDGLAVGEALAAFKVDRIDVTDDEIMRRSVAVKLAHPDGRGFTVWIARKGVHKFLPFESTDRYAFYHGQYQPAGTAPSEADIAGVASALVPRVRKAEAVAPIPATLTN